MIIEGAQAGSVSFWSQHLQRTDTNEQVLVHETRGTLSQDLEGALREMQAVADGSRSRGNFLYQANINPRAGEHLTPEQWQKAVDTLEKNLGFEDHQRVVVEHVKDGRQHYHVIWNRVDVDTMRVRDITGNYYNHERTARELEREFGLERPPRVYGEREGERESKRTDLWEYNRGHESGQSPKAIKAELTTLWGATDSGRVFIDALEQRGYILARGDRRDFCIIDRAGDEHSLARRLDGVTAKQLRERLAFVDRESLPSVAQAKEIHEERRAEHGRENAGREAPVDYEPPKEMREHSGTVAEHRDQDRSESRGTDGGQAIEDAGIMVLDGVVNVAVKLADFVADLFSAFLTPAEPKRTVLQQLGEDPAERVARIKAGYRAEAALESIRGDLQRGSTISAADVRSLSPGQLQQIAQQGDAGLLAMVKQLEEQRERERDQGRTRER